MCVAAFLAGAAVTTWGWQLEPGGWQREDRVERTQGQEPGVLMCLLCEVRQLCAEVENEGSVLRA